MQKRRNSLIGAPGLFSFLVAIYVLGADWWGKFRRIFVWEAAES